MNSVLLINASPNGQVSHANQLALELVKTLRQHHPRLELVGSGGFHQGEKARQPDFMTPYLRQVLGTLGLLDPHFTYLQGLVFGAEAVEAALQESRARLALEPLFNPLVKALRAPPGSTTQHTAPQGQ